MTALGIIWCCLALVFIASAVVVIVLAETAPVIDEPDPRDVEREAFERMLHPSGSGLADLDRHLDDMYGGPR